jgi:hypothetical protein
LLLLSVALGFAAQAQVDPVKRQLVQVGYNQPLQGVSPLGGYAFYYLNEPDYPRTNLTLRLAVAPVYLDAELGLRGLLGPNTDLGLGLDGGGFADSYSEARGGHYIREESYLGHGFGANVSLYHRFNPSQELPLYGVVRAGYHYAFYGRDSGTAAGFSEPENLGQGIVRAGLRLGGGEPVLIPDLGVELSGWYEGRFRTDQTPYGYGGDRFLARDSHLIWGRMGLNYSFKGGQNLALNLTGGTCLNPDRLSAYRLGSWLPMGSEFPLNLPGYYYQEISARNFVNASAQWIQPLDHAQRWSLLAMVATAVVNYAPGLEQPGKWHTGLGAGIAYRPPSKAWQVIVGYGYGVDAIRHDERGAHSIGLLAQFDFQKARTALLDPGNQPLQSRGLQNFFRKIF